MPLDRVSELLGKGLNQAEIAQNIGCSASTVSRLRTKLKRDYLNNYQEDPRSLRISNAFTALPRDDPVQSQAILDARVKKYTKQDFDHFRELSGESTISFRAGLEAKELLSLYTRTHKPLISVNQFCREAVFEKLQKNLQERKK